MAKAFCTHPWRAGSCRNCPLRSAAPKRTAGQARPAMPAVRPAQQRTAPSGRASMQEATDAAAALQRAVRGASAESLASVRGQALRARADMLLAQYREAMRESRGQQGPHTGAR